MKRLSAAMRRTNRLLRRGKLTTTTRALQQAMTGLMVASAMAPLAPMAGVMPKARARTPKPPPGADSAPQIDRRHRSAAGSRDYTLFLPKGGPMPPKALIVMLHGCNQTPAAFARSTHMNALAQKNGLAIAYPAQARGKNAAACWNWFEPAHQRRGGGEPAILASLTRSLMKELGLGRDAVFVAGLSAGGAMAAILADVYPDVFSAAGIHSGLARGAAHGTASALAAMRGGAAKPMPPGRPHRAAPVRWIIFQGSQDPTVHSSNAARLVAAVVGSDAVPTRSETRSSGGRSYGRCDYADATGATRVEHWLIQTTGHAWSGGRGPGPFTDLMGPDASAQMVRFFLA